MSRFSGHIQCYVWILLTWSIQFYISREISFAFMLDCYLLQDGTEVSVATRIHTGFALNAGSRYIAVFGQAAFHLASEPRCLGLTVTVVAIAGPPYGNSIGSWTAHPLHFLSV